MRVKPVADGDSRITRNNSIYAISTPIDTALSIPAYEIDSRVITCVGIGSGIATPVYIIEVYIMGNGLCHSIDSDGYCHIHCYGPLRGALGVVAAKDRAGDGATGDIDEDIAIDIGLAISAVAAAIEVAIDSAPREGDMGIF